MNLVAGNFAEAMNKALSVNGYTKYRLAKLTGVSEGLLSRLASGKQLPADETIAKLAPVLGVAFEYLQAAALADRVGDHALERLAAFHEETHPAKHNNDARLSQLHELKILNETLSKGSGPGSVIQATGKQAEGTLKIDEYTDRLRFVALPLYGPAACGEPPSWSLDDALETYPVPQFVLDETGAAAVFKVTGDSMTAENIKDGAYVLVSPYNGDKPQPGDIVIVQTEGSYLCKMYQKNLLGAYLESRYEGRDPEPWKAVDEVVIVGQVHGGIWLKPKRRR